MKLNKINLDYNGYLLIVASNGDKADYKIIYDIKIFNPNVAAKENLDNYEGARKKHYFDFSSKKIDTLHKYAEKQLKTKEELVERVNYESMKIKLAMDYFLHMSERHFQEEFKMVLYLYHIYILYFHFYLFYQNSINFFIEKVKN